MPRRRELAQPVAYNQGLSTAKLQGAKQGMENEMGMGIEIVQKS